MYQFLYQLFPSRSLSYQKIRNIPKLTDYSEEDVKLSIQKHQSSNEDKSRSNHFNNNLPTVHKPDRIYTQLNLYEQRQFFTGLSHLQVNGLRLKILQLGTNGQLMGNSLKQSQNQLVKEKCHIAICISEEVQKRVGKVDNMHKGQESEYRNGENVYVHADDNNESNYSHPLYYVVFNLQLLIKNQSPHKSHNNNNQYTHQTTKQEIKIVDCRKLFPQLEYSIKQFYHNSIRSANQNKEDGQNVSEKQLKMMVLMSLRSRFDEKSNTFSLIESIDSEHQHSSKYRFDSNHSMIGIKLYLLSYLTNIIQSHHTLSQQPQMIQYQHQQLDYEQQQEQQMQLQSLSINKKQQQQFPIDSQSLYLNNNNDYIKMINEQFDVVDQQQQCQQQGQQQQSLSQSISIEQHLPVIKVTQSQPQPITIFNFDSTSLLNSNPYNKTQVSFQKQITFIQSQQNTFTESQQNTYTQIAQKTVSFSMMIQQQNQQNHPTNQRKQNLYDQTNEYTPLKSQFKKKLSLLQQSQTTTHINSYHKISQLSHNKNYAKQHEEIQPIRLLFQEHKDISNKKDNFQTLTKPYLMPYQTQSLQQHEFMILSQQVIIKKLPLQQQPTSKQQELDAQQIKYRNFHRTTYTLVKSQSQHIICLQILKEHGKLFQNSKEVTSNLEQQYYNQQQIDENQLLQQQSQNQPQQSQKQQKRQPIKLLLYNPVVLDQQQHIKLSPDYHCRSDIVESRQRLINQLHFVNDFVISNDQSKLLLYSKTPKQFTQSKENKENVNIVLEYDIENQLFINMYEVPSVYNEVRNIIQMQSINQTSINGNNNNHNNQPLPLKQVLYSPNSTEKFYTLTEKEITLIPTINGKNQTINYHISTSQKPNNHQLLKPRVFLYENCLTISRDLERRFDSMCAYEDSEKVVVGMKGRQVKVFDLSKCKQVGVWIGGNVDVRKYRQLKYNKLRDIQNTKSSHNNNNFSITPLKKHKKINKKLLLSSTSLICKQSLVTPKNKTNNHYPMLIKNPLPQQLYYLKALNSFYIQQCGEKICHQEQPQYQSYLDKGVKQQFIYKRPMIGWVQIIYNNPSKQQTEYNQKEIVQREPQYIVCEREEFIMGKRVNEYFRIDCQQKTKEGMRVNCFQNKLRISNRSLIKSVAYEDVIDVLNEGQCLRML